MPAPVITFIDANGKELTLSEPLSYGTVDAGQTLEYSGNPVYIWNMYSGNPSGVSTIENVKITTITMNPWDANGDDPSTPIASGREVVSQKWVQVKSSGYHGFSGGYPDWDPTTNYPMQSGDMQETWTAVGGVDEGDWLAIGDINPSGARSVYFKIATPSNATPAGSNKSINFKTRLSFSYV